MPTHSVLDPSPLADPDDAYANAAHVAASGAIVARWPSRAAAFRERLSNDGRLREHAHYGPGSREWLDWFEPELPARGVAIIVHGGYWMRFSPTDFSHLAAGAVDSGWLTVLPAYPLAPDASIPEITDAVRRAVIAAAELADGPIRLAGHSAGGQLVTRMLCDDVALPASIASRIDRTLALSGVLDLVPLLATSMNDTLGLDRRSAIAESPARCLPRAAVRACAWVGGDERPEFIRQNGLLNIWHGMGARIATHLAPGRHHFDVIDDLARAGSPMIEWWLGER